MQILLIMLIVIFLAFSVLLLALAKQSPREKQTEDKEQEEYIRDYAETVRQTGGSMKKLEHWKVIAIYLIIYDMIAVNFSYFMALLVRFDFRYSSIPTDYFAAWRSFAPIYTIIILAVFGCMHLYNSVWRFAIMPSWNTGMYIAESIRSVIDQTYENWELIIVDDCSTDDTDEIVGTFTDKRIKYLKNEKNSGAALTRNRALREAKGEWIAFLDSDDLWKPEKIEHQLEFMKKHNLIFSYHEYRMCSIIK